MTLIEFIAPIKGGQREKCLAVLFFVRHYEGKPSLTVDGIREGLRRARVSRWQKINVADVLSKSGGYVDTPGLEGNRRLWQLTLSGDEYVRVMLGLPKEDVEIQHDVTTLTKIAGRIADAVVREYVNEAILCLRVGALRAAIVFLWTGAIRTLQEQAYATGGTALNAALKKHDQGARNVGKVDDFAYVKDSVALLAFQEIGLLDKGEKATLEEALNLRNRCGHPTQYTPGMKKTSSFVEDVVGIVFA